MASNQLLLCSCIVLMSVLSVVRSDWDSGHATFYGDIDGKGTMEGACGYGDLFKQGYGLETTALSSALFNNGKTCGACYEVQCVGSQYCKSGSIKVTATNYCPPSNHPSGNWCNAPQKHFDLTQAMFLKIAEYKAGIVPIQFRKVPCVKSGGLKFEINGNPNFLLVVVFNVGGAGDVVDVKVKGSSTGWLQMTRNWGDKWNNGTPLVGQSLSFQVTTSDGKWLELDNVAPANWQFGQTYEGSTNF